MILPNQWDQRYLSLAHQIGSWSKDPSSKIGAVAIGEHGQILSQGYNGFPRGVEDLEERLNDREVKYDFTVHAEKNCIYNACLNGVSLNGSTIYIFGLPMCHKCAPGIIQVGVRTVVMAAPADSADRWVESWSKSKIMLNEKGLSYELYHFDGPSDNWIDSARLAERRRHKHGRVWTYPRSGSESVS